MPDGGTKDTEKALRGWIAIWMCCNERQSIVFKVLMSKHFY